MEISYKFTNETKQIKSMVGAIETLNEIGLSDNGAYVIEPVSKAQEYFIMIYESLLFEPNSKNVVARPDTPTQLEKFLYDLFDPFLFKSDRSIRSVISVHQYSQTELKAQPVKDVKSGEKLFQIQMLLYLQRETYSETVDELNRLADSLRPYTAHRFGLD